MNDCRRHEPCRALPRTIALTGLGLIVALSGGCVGREKTLFDARTRGDAALREGRYSDAVTEYEAYLATRPGRDAVLYELGLAYQGMGELSAAREAFTVAYELDPDNPVFIEALARSMASNGEADAAFALLERIAVESQRAEAYTRLGDLLLDEGLADEGVLALVIAARLQPSAGSYGKLASTYARFEDRQKEIQALRHVLWFAPGDEAARERVRALGEIPGPTFAAQPTN